MRALVTGGTGFVGGALVRALINRGDIQVIKATGKSFEKVASWRVAQGSTWAPPVLLQHGILVKDLENLTFWAL